MKKLRTYIIIVAFSALTLFSCSKDDDSTDNDDSGALLSIGTCGEFFNGADLTSLCGVQDNVSLNIGTDDVCTYIINPDQSTSQELYSATLFEFATEAEAKDFYSQVIQDTSNGETVTPITNIGAAAVFVEDQKNTDYGIIFYQKNIVSAVAADELLGELGCDNPQARLRDLANLIIASAQ